VAIVDEKINFPSFYQEWLKRPMVAENCHSNIVDCPHNRSPHRHRADHHGGMAPFVSYTVEVLPRCV